MCFGSLLLGCAGCGASQTPVEAPAVQQNIKAVGLAYTQHLDEKKRPPANLDELMPFLKKVGDPDKLLQSPNDGEQFVILYGVDHRSYSSEGKPVPVTVYEKTGRGGKRFVFRANRVMHMTDEELQASPFPPGKKAP